jgi:hypothetical protein
MRPFSISVSDPDFSWEVGDAFTEAMWRRRRSLQRRSVSRRGKYPRDLTFFYHLLLKAQYKAATVGDTRLLNHLTKRAYELGWLRVGRE